MYLEIWGCDASGFVPSQDCLGYSCFLWFHTNFSTCSSLSVAALELQWPRGLQSHTWPSKKMGANLWIIGYFCYHLLNIPFIPKISCLRFFRAKNQWNKKPYSMRKLQFKLVSTSTVCFALIKTGWRRLGSAFLLTTVLSGCHFSSTEVSFTLLLGLLPLLLLLHFPGCFLSLHFNLSHHLCPCLFTPVLHTFFMYSFSSYKLSFNNSIVAIFFKL